MTYLVIKIILFLLAAAALGGGLAWYVRHAMARTELERMSRTMREVQSLVPKFETNIQSRDQRIEKLKADIGKWKQKYPALAKKLDEREATLRERDRKIHLLEGQIAVLRLSQSTDDESQDLSSASDEDRERAETLAVELKDQQLRVRDLVRVMDDQTQQIEELTVERERQRKSMSALNEQLEIAQQTNTNLANTLQHSRAELRNVKSQSGKLRVDEEQSGPASKVASQTASANGGPAAPIDDPSGSETASSDQPTAEPEVAAAEPPVDGEGRPANRPAGFSLPSQPPANRRKMASSPRVLKSRRS